METASLVSQIGLQAKQGDQTSQSFFFFKYSIINVY